MLGMLFFGSYYLTIIIFWIAYIINYTLLHTRRNILYNTRYTYALRFYKDNTKKEKYKDVLEQIDTESSNWFIWFIVISIPILNIVFTINKVHEVILQTIKLKEVYNIVR